MIAANPNSSCEQAKSYYYQYLSGDTKECIPTQMLGHIDGCHSCQADIRRLKDILTEEEEHDSGSASQATVVATTYLRLHFSYIGAFVNCNTLKLFLPSLAIPALEVSVPTPITVHLEKCQQCASDLEAIRQLKLSDKQLTRLAQLFAEESMFDTNVCAEAHNAIESVGAMAFEGTSSEILKHLCGCPKCRKLLYENRKRRIEVLPQNLEQSPIACDSISATDIFDYVVPYGIDPERGLPASRSSTSHLINCPRCLDKVQKLHETVYGILGRRESGIVTCFKLDESVKSSAVGSPEDLYEDWPIEVQVFDKSAETKTIKTRDTSAVGGLSVSPGPEPGRKLSFLRPFIKPAAAAAAVILAALFLFNAPAAKAVNLGQIYKTLGRITNVHTVMFEFENTEPTQEMYISQTSKAMILKSEKECVSYDIKNKSQKSKDLNTGSITTVKMDKRVRAKIQEMMKAPWGLLPSHNTFKLYPDAKWGRAPDENIKSPIRDTEVYDLTWTEQEFASRRWRGYIDIKTGLPRKIEWELKLPDEKEYKLETITIVYYPTEAEILTSINKLGF
ncbi:MAG: hypothetical protein ACYS32_01175 [Planctomycetota bacterium]|jgi:hypothetical protein